MNILSKLNDEGGDEEERLRPDGLEYDECEVFEQRDNLQRLAEVLAVIRADALYGASYTSFDDYMRRRFGWEPEFVAAIIKFGRRNRKTQTINSK